MNIIRIDYLKTRPSIAGVYIVLSPDKNNVLYIGQSQNINKRFHLHKEYQINHPNRGGNHWYNNPLLIIPIDDINQRTILETSLIGLLNPTDNREVLCKNRKLCLHRIGLVKSGVFTIPINPDDVYRVACLNKNNRKIRISKPISGKQADKWLPVNDSSFYWIEPDLIHNE